MTTVFFATFIEILLVQIIVAMGVPRRNPSGAASARARLIREP
jgi:hypothetical protein